MAKLQQAVQVTVAGLPQSGKTSLINMLLGWSIVPDLRNVQIVTVVYGPQPRSLVEYQDGTFEEICGIIEDRVFDRPVSRVTIELPEDKLLTQCFCEVTLAGSDAEIARLLEDVAKTSALLIWASNDVSAEEQQMWRAVPEHVKDHSFLALTMADRHQMTGKLVQKVRALEPFVAQEFYGLYPVATLQALKARLSSMPDHAKLWTLSGGEALCAVIEQQVSLGLAEDLDRAKVLLEMVGAEQLNQAETAGPTVHDIPALTQDEAHPHAPKSSGVTHLGASALKKAMQELESCAKYLATDVGHDTEDLSPLFSRCIETVQNLSETLADVACQDTLIDALLQDTRQGENMLILLQLEDNEDAAVDALSLMVQLKKEVAATAAA
ncbi:MAG: hypothetical protein AAF280_00330 [Pseudomonadota bacterium]